MEAEMDNAAELEPLNLLDISVELGEENENPLYEWITPSHMDGPDGEPDPKVAEEAQNLGIDIDRVIAEEVLSSEDAMRTDSVHSKSSDSSDTNTGGGDSDGDDDGDDGRGGRNYGAGASPRPLLSPFSCEADFTHATEDEDHGSRRAGPGIGAIGKHYSRRKRGQNTSSQQDVDSLSSNFESMSIGSQQSHFGYGTDSSQDTYPHQQVQPVPYQSYNPYGMGQYNTDPSGAYIYGQQYPYQQPIDYMPNPYSMYPSVPPHTNEGAPETEQPDLPPMGILRHCSTEEYDRHLQNYLLNYANYMKWPTYCRNITNMERQNRDRNDDFEPPRNSMWY